MGGISPRSGPVAAGLLAAAVLLATAGCGSSITAAASGALTVPGSSQSPGAASGGPAGPAAVPPAAHRRAGSPRCPAPGAAGPVRELCAALTRARAGHREVLLDFGAGWCVQCATLAAYFRSPALRELLLRDYSLVRVDVGRWNRNIGFADRYFAMRHTGIPALVVLGRSGAIRVATDQFDGGGGRLTKARVRAFLARWAAAR